MHKNALFYLIKSTTQEKNSQVVDFKGKKSAFFPLLFRIYLVEYIQDGDNKIT